MFLTVCPTTASQPPTLPALIVPARENLAVQLAIGEKYPSHVDAYQWRGRLRSLPRSA